MTLPTLDGSAFDHLLEITGNDLEFVDELIDTYLADALVQLDAMRAAAASGDAEALVRPAHSLKSSSANVGAFPLSEFCQEIENTISRKDAAALKGLLGSVGGEYFAVEEALKQVLYEITRNGAA